MSTRQRKNVKTDGGSAEAKSESANPKVGKVEAVGDSSKAVDESAKNVDDAAKSADRSAKSETSTSAVPPSQHRVLRPRGFRRSVKELFALTQYCVYSRSRKRSSSSQPKVVKAESPANAKKPKLAPIPEVPETDVSQEEGEVGPSSSVTEKPDTLPSNGFERGLTVEAIIAALDITGDKMFLVKFKNQEQLELIPLNTAKRLCPQVVIAFYEARLRLQWTQNGSAPHILSMDDDT
ncbi:hypothetical protein M514_04806 [Trichuris suis]|uniref:Chromo shadow domain-containing protein n=1 Tax=Trichuris suis TaxID=68888 RepID=A0A085NUN6_9BILA|nr:hypothetical protein M513_04806 [Trichuris suis]KFD73182.1 hypothetical protein M514_04806 [Trichuris suis]KHJ45579.1 chromo shadow domain protein [Trichuris suis]